MSQTYLYRDADINNDEYLIVEFPEEESDGSMPMAIISSLWVFEKGKNTYCYWPTYLKSTTKREKAVIAHAQLDKKKCTECLIRVKTTSIDYQKLHRKLKKLEEEEEDSQGESEPQKRKTKHPLNSSMYDYSEALSDEEEIPPAPLLRKDRSQDQHLNKINDNQRKTIAEFAITPKGVLNKVTSTPRKIIELSESSSTTFMRNSDKNPNCNCQCTNLEGILKDMLNSLEGLKSDTKYLLQLNLNKDLELLADSDIICLNSLEEIEEFNISLKDKDFFQKTTTKLSLIGGKDVGAITRKILCQIISHPLSLTLNWTGRNHKTGIKDEETLLQLMISSVRRNINGRSATVDDIESAIKSWLRNAGDRAGGRISRKKTLSSTVLNTED